MHHRLLSAVFLTKINRACQLKSQYIEQRQLKSCVALNRLSYFHFFNSCYSDVLFVIMFCLILILLNLKTRDFFFFFLIIISCELLSQLEIIEYIESYK